MNKAEEQYLYSMGRARANSDIMWMGYELNKTIQEHDGAEWVVIFKQRIQGFISLYQGRENWEGYIDSCQSILNYMKYIPITDWPSFVTYMTGETYEKEVGHE